MNIGSTSPAQPSTGQPASLATLPNSELHRYWNIYAVQVLIPLVFRNVLNWGCPGKDNNKSYRQYIIDTKQFSSGDIKNKFGHQRNFLQQNNCTSFDVSLLYLLIQLLCGGLKASGHKDWTDENKMEGLLYILKQNRNWICHDDKSKATSEDAFSDIKVKLLKLIELSKSQFSIDKCVIDAAIVELNKKICINKEDLTRKIVNSFHKMALAEAKENWQKYTEFIPFVDIEADRKEVFHPLELSIKDITEKYSSSKQIIISHKQLLKTNLNQHNNDPIIIVGEAGAGKTTLLKMIATDFFDEDKQINGLDNFRMIHYTECRNRTICNIDKLMESNFPFTLSTTNMDKKDYFLFLNNLVLVDAYDEGNEKSKELLNQLLTMARTMPHCKVIITTRPHALERLEGLLMGEGLKYLTYQLQGINVGEDQIMFLKKYDQCINTSNNSRQQAASEVFTSLPDEVRDAFVIPIYLIIFCFLCKSNPENIKNWKSIQDFFRNIVTHYKNMIKKKLQSKQINDIDFVINNMFKEINHFSFKCLANDKISLLASEYEELRSKLCDKLTSYGVHNDVEAEAILSTVFITKTTPSLNSNVTYQFFHKSIQEIFASHTLIEDIKDGKKKLGDIFYTNLDDTTKLDKWLNVVQFAIIEMVASGQQVALLPYLPELQDMMESARAEFPFLADLAANCSDNKAVVEMAARVAAKVSDIWVVATSQQVTGAACMMRTALPRDTLDFILHQPSDGLTALLEAMKDRYSGSLMLQLSYSYDNYKACDHVIAHLKGARCRLLMFRGCIDTKEALLTLTSVAGRCASLHISTTAAHRFNYQELRRIKTEREIDKVTIAARASDLLGFNLESWSRHPSLAVKDASTAAAVVATVLATAHADKKYDALFLSHSSLSDAALNDLLQKLAAKGVRTIRSNGTGWHQADLTAVPGRTWCAACEQASHTDDGHRCIELHVT